MMPSIPYDPGGPADPDDVWMLDLCALIAAAMLVFAPLAGMFVLARERGCVHLVAVGPLGGAAWLPCGTGR